MMKVPREVVEHVSRLAHIGLSPDELDHMAEQLSSVIDHVSRLQEIDTTGVEVTAHAANIDTVLRQDEVRPSWPVAAVIANAPHHVDKQFEVQAILE